MYSSTLSGNSTPQNCYPKTVLLINNLTLFTRVSDPFPVYLGNGLSKDIMVISTLTIIINLAIIIFFLIIAIFIIIINLVIVVIIIIVINIIVIIIFLLFQGPQQWGSSIL